MHISSFFPVLLSFEHQTALVMASVRVLVSDLQNEFVWPLARSPDDSSRLTARTVIKNRSEEHTSELQSRLHLVCRLLLEKKKNRSKKNYIVAFFRAAIC